MFKRRTKAKTICVVFSCAVVIVLLLKTVVSPNTKGHKQAEESLVKNEQFRRWSSNNVHCKPRKNIVFVKTHKTGSSTVTNILHRHGDRYDLTFALPRVGQNRLDWPWIMRNSSFQLIGETQPNIVCHHGRYNRAILEKLIPRDAVYVTILRHPVNQYESTFYYNGFEDLLGIKNKTDSIEYFLEKPKEVLINYLLTEDLRVNSDRLKLIRNGMSFDLGLNSTYFDDKLKIQEFLQILRKQFDLVMIAEYFDESLILLKDLLCWPLEELSYFDLNVRHQSNFRFNISRKVIDAMRRWNNVDFEIYRQFRRILLEKIAEKNQSQSGIRFRADLTQLRHRNHELRKLCLRNITKTRTAQYGVKMKRLELNGGLKPEIREMCDHMRRDEVDYLRLLRDKQSGFLESVFLGKVRKTLVWYLKFVLELLSKT